MERTKDQSEVVDSLRTVEDAADDLRMGLTGESQNGTMVVDTALYRGLVGAAETLAGIVRAEETDDSPDTIAKRLAVDLFDVLSKFNSEQSTSGSTSWGDHMPTPTSQGEVFRILRESAGPVEAYRTQLEEDEEVQTPEAQDESSLATLVYCWQILGKLAEIGYNAERNEHIEHLVKMIKEVDPTALTEGSSPSRE